MKWMKKKYLWEGTVSLAALLLSHVVHTSMEILNCPWIVDSEGLFLPVSVGGGVEGPSLSLSHTHTHTFWGLTCFETLPFLLIIESMKE